MEGDAGEVAALLKRNEELENEVARLRAAAKESDVALVTQELKAKNLELFTRLATQKSATKTAQEELAKKDTQICILTEHIDKLMNVIKQEGLNRKNAELRKDEAETELRSYRAEMSHLKLSTRTAKKRASTISKHDKMLEKQLQVMDQKFKALYQSHEKLRASSSRKERAYMRQIENISGAVWSADNKCADVSTARANTLLGSCKLLESIFGDMTCTVLDFQECLLGDSGVKAISKALQASVARQNQRSASMQESHAQRFKSWDSNGREGPLPTAPALSGSDPQGGKRRRSCVLNLAFNGITDSGVKSLCVALAKSRHVVEVDLRGNFITRRAIPFIADMLMYNGMIEAVDLSGNHFGKNELADYIANIEARAARALRRRTESKSTEEHSSSSSSESSSDESDSDSEGEGAAGLAALPVLSSRDKVNHSFFRYSQAARPRSAPPRSRTTVSEQDPSSFLPTHEFHSKNEPAKCTRSVRREDILMQVDKARLFPPQKSPQSALARITLDSISAKMAQVRSRQVLPRPESAMVSREGGQEHPIVARSMVSSQSRTTVAGAARPRTATVRPGLKSSTGGKVQFSPSKIRSRLQISTKRPSTAPGKRQTTPTPSPVNLIGSQKPSKAGKKSKRTKVAQKNLGDAFSKAKTAQQMRFAPPNLQSAFTFARKGNIVGLISLMADVDPTPLMSANELVSFAPNMRQINTGETVIMHAARHGQDKVVELMLEKGGDINAVSLDGWTCLHHAIEAGQLRMVEALLQYGSDANIGEGTKHGTALHLAVRLGKMDAICRLLDSSKVDVQVRDAKGRTPLHISALTGRAHLARLLRANGADPKAKDGRNKTPLSYAEQRNDLNMQEALLC